MHGRHAAAAGGEDMLNVMEIEVPDLTPEEAKLVERGKKERVMILRGTELEGRQGEPFARTHVSITLENEKALRECVRLLRWSDERLRAHPEQLMLWDWTRTFREGMTILFGVNWYDREFFERRKDAFQEPRHAAFYSRFGASAQDFVIEHEVLD